MIDKLDTIIHGISDRIDEWAKTQKGRYSERYDKAIDNMADDAKKKFWRHYNVLKGEFRGRTMSTLRHEFAHETFSNWGLQKCTNLPSRRPAEPSGCIIMILLRIDKSVCCYSQCPYAHL